MCTEIFIRPTVAADLEAIKLIAEATELFPGHMLDDMIGGYLEGTKTDMWLTAHADGGQIAFAFCEPERMTVGTWNLLAIGVSPNRQNQGTGTKLIRYLETVLRQAGHRVLLVETLGTAAFERTRSFYLANAFSQEARVREFYDKGSDKVIFWKRL